MQAAKVLAAHRFRVITGEEGEARTLFADRNRFGKAALSSTTSGS